jgi:hypothetical protein
MGKLLTADLGTGIIGWRGEINGSMVCVATPRVLHDPAAWRKMRDLVKLQGGDCDGCQGCPLGQGNS